MAYFHEKDFIHFCIEKLSSVCGSSVQLQNSCSIGGGCINNAMQLSTSAGNFFLKWNASAPKDLFEKEAAGLMELSQANSLLVVPKVIFCKKSDDFPGLILMEFLLPAGHTLGFDEQLGRGLAQLHRKSAKAFGFHHSNYCGTTVHENTWTESWPEFYARHRIGALVDQIQNSRGFSLDELKIYRKLIERIPLLLPRETIPSLIHGDLWSGNYIYTANGAALIDPACYYADREMELGMMKLFGGFSSRVWSAYQEEWLLPAEWKERLRLYQLYHVLNHYLLFGGSYGRQALEIARVYL
jgi:fructosamine-3-kinase